MLTVIWVVWQGLRHHVFKMNYSVGKRCMQNEEHTGNNAYTSLEIHFPLLFKWPLLLCKWSDEFYALLRRFFVTHSTWLIESLSRHVSWRSDGLLQIREWVQRRARARQSVRTCEWYKVFHAWNPDFIKISANLYNGNYMYTCNKQVILL